MSIRHHPSHETLLAHAAGTLDPALSLVVDVHLRQCTVCTREHLWNTAVGGAVLEAHDPEPMPDDLVERCLGATKARLSQVKKNVADDAPPDAAACIEPSAEWLTQNLNSIAWKKLTTNIEQFVVPGLRRGKSWARLFRFQPGTVVPRHRHQGDEFAVVLHGAYLDQAEQFAIGDFAETDASVNHELKVAGDEPCIALIASTGHINPNNLAYRAAFRLFGL